jgi:hypothetical protein
VISARSLTFLLLGLCTALACGAATVTRMREAPKPRPAQLLLYDFGYASPFAVTVGYYAGRKECGATRSKRVLGIEVADFGEGADKATFCLDLDGNVWNVALSQVEDVSSEAGRAAIVSITYRTERGPRLLKVRVTPWGASIEP